MKTIIAPLLVSAPTAAYTPLPMQSRVEVGVQQEKILDELMQKRPQFEKEKIISSWDTSPQKRTVEAQSSIDSIAYRNLFESTQLANDSDKVAEFNKIRKNSIPDNRWGFPTYGNEMDKIMLKNGVSQKEINKLKGQNQIGRETFPGGFTKYTNRDNLVALAKYQFQIDSVAYQRFFEKHNAIDNNLKNGIKAIAKKIKPVM